jgi:RNA polymerase sigma-70 factor (ECF subfamily)
MPNIPQLARKQKSHSGEKTSPSLLDALRNNQPDGWFRLDRLYHPLVCFWCARLGANREDVSDICQTVFLTAFAKLETFEHRGPGSFRAWLRDITRNHVRTNRRKCQCQPRGEGGSEAHFRLQEYPEVLPPDEEDPPAEIAALCHRCLQLIRSDFPPHYFEACCRHLMGEQTVAEVAQELGISTALVRKALSRIRKRLHEILGDEPSTEEPAVS